MSEWEVGDDISEWEVWERANDVGDDDTVFGSANPKPPMSTLALLRSE